VAPRPTVPTIGSFKADATAIGIGNGTTLRWSVTNAVGAVQVQITAVGTVAASGSSAITPAATTTYVLTATNTQDSTKVVSASVTVTVVPKPVISFSVGSAGGPSSGIEYKGHSTSLWWTVLDTTSAPLTLNVSINGTTSLGASGSMTVTPASATTYTLTATNNYGGSATAQATVTVTGAPVITSFTASVNPVTVGGTTVLSWSTQGDTSRTLNGVALPGGISSIVVAPSKTQDYVLVAANPAGTATQTLTIPVQGSGSPAWVRDIVYIGGKELAEFDPSGMHITQVDHLGSPRIVVNGAGAVESTQKFLPFGETVDRSGSLITAKGFTNHEQTDPSGLIYMQARFYLPQYHRFASPDPVRDQHFEETQSWNIYSYVQNNPMTHTDPTGQILEVPDCMKKGEKSTAPPRPKSTKPPAPAKKTITTTSTGAKVVSEKSITDHTNLTKTVGNGECVTLVVDLAPGEVPNTGHWEAVGPVNKDTPLDAIVATLPKGKYPSGVDAKTKQPNPRHVGIFRGWLGGPFRIFDQIKSRDPKGNLLTHAPSERIMREDGHGFVNQAGNYSVVTWKTGIGDK
jgi:RHS repeat-associated protein